MMSELFKCFLAGLAGFAAIALLVLAGFLLWPYSGYAIVLFLCIGMCVGLGSDIRSGRGPR